MPQEVQIVPKYLHPHVETYINDYTQFEDDVAGAVDNNSKFICVFTSSQGIDNVLIKKTELADFRKTYGKSNFSKYGQPLMMPIAMLTAGSSSCYCMRVMPEDAFPANAILNMLYRFDETTGKMDVKFRTTYLPKSSMTPGSYATAKAFKKALYTAAVASEPEQPDADGFKQIPVATFRVTGRGVYGNKYRWRITRNMDYEMDYGIKMYSFEVLNTSTGLSKIATYVGAACTSKRFKNLTLINDILDDQAAGAAAMDVQIIEENVERVYDEFMDFVLGPEDADGVRTGGLDDSMIDDCMLDEEDPFTLDYFDIFFGMKVASELKHKNINVIPADTITNSDDISVDALTGSPLAGGDDGAFALDPATATYQSALINAYNAAFDGTYDRSILSTRRVPCNAILDANYPFSVKETMATLVNTRNDCLLFLDSGVETTLANVDDTIDLMAEFNTRNVVKEFQHYQVKDYETKKKVDVTTTFYFAQSIPVHYRNIGSWVPFVKRYATLTGHVKNSLEPVVDDVDMELKEKLYKARINYFEAISENNYQRATQNTAQNFNSDLMEENNMNTLMELKRELEDDCWASLYDFTDRAARERWSRTEMAKFSSWIGTRLDTLEIKFDTNEWEMERSIVHCYVSVQFRNLMKRVIVEIDINKRNFLG